MANYSKTNTLAKFIIGQSDSYNAIADAVKSYAIHNRHKLEFLDNPSTYIEFEDIDFKYALNVTIEEEIVNFDTVVEGSFSYKTGNRHRDFDDEIGCQWFGLHCVMAITDKLESFHVTRIEICTNEQKKELANPATADFVPVMHKKDFDLEAEKFLARWYPQALKEPMRLPIKEIAEERMGLAVIDDIPLTKDLSVFGQICFADGEIKTYDKTLDIYVETKVTRGTVFIDPDTYFLRCLGCANNTLAHEAFHWERHRVYATVKNILNKQSTIAHRCPTAPKGNIVRDTLSKGEDWMEWQANGIAPKILMPKTPAIRKVKEVAAAHNYDQNNPDTETLKIIIDELADFYGVSKQAAKIRMIELGYTEANEVYNYDSDCTLLAKEISAIDAYTEYENNEDFCTLFDMGLFRSVEGYFVIDAPLYRNESTDGAFVLTDYARENLDECTLTFEYNIAELFEFNRDRGVLYREKQQRQARPPQNIFSPKYNQTAIDKALAEVSRAQRQIEAAQEFGDITAAQQIARYMERTKPKWNSSIFQERTGLSKNEYSKIMTKPNRSFKLPTIVSICVGLKLPAEHARELITKAGFVLGKSSPEDIAYSMILAGVVSDNILACNAFIEGLEQKNPNYEIRKLGSQMYDT
jgi:hypothetical protein